MAQSWDPNSTYDPSQTYDPAYTDTYGKNLAEINVSQSLHYYASQLLASQTNPKTIVVGIIDGMMRASHQEFGNATVTFVPAPGGTYTTPADHATHVAGIAGAELNNLGMVGVYPWADFVNVGLFDDNGDTGVRDDWLLAQAAAYSAKVINMSYGYTLRGELATTSDVTAWAAHPDMVLVRAAGNSGAKLSSIYYTGDTEHDFSHVLIVGSVNTPSDPTVLPTISSFSNVPGESCFYSTTTHNKADCTEASKFKYLFIVAPGELVQSSVATSDSSYGLMSGTSMATPHVTGAAALVWAIWPDLSAADVASILKQTATDLGTPGVDSTYGWGLLNVQCALTCPLGDLTIVISDTTSGGGGGGGGGKKSGGGGGKPFALNVGAEISSGRINMASVGKALAGLTAFDKFGRDFNGSYLAKAYADNATSFSFLREFFGYINASAASIQIRTAPSRRGFDRGLGSHPAGPARQGVWLGAVSSYGSPDMFSDDRSHVSLFEANKRHVVSSILQGGVYQGFFAALNDRSIITWRVSSLRRGSSDLNRSGTATDLELKVKTSDNVVMSLAMSYTQEDGTVLGTSGTGAFDLADGASTVGFEHHVAVRLSNRLFLDVATMATMTNTNNRPGRVSLFSDVGTIWSFGGSVQLTGYKVMANNDALTLAVGLPLQTISGHAVISGGLFDRSTRQLYYEDYSVSLRSNEVWSASLIHAFALANGAINVGYGGYAQFAGSGFDEVGFGFSFSMKL